MAAIMGGLYGDGIIGLKGAFPAATADSIHQDIMALFDEARDMWAGIWFTGTLRCRSG